MNAARLNPGSRRRTSPGVALERVRQICLALPDTQEKEAWSVPTFRVRGKMFVMFMNNHHGDGRLAIWCKAQQEVQSMQVVLEPKHCFVPPYVGPRGWLGIRLDTGLGWESVTGFIKDAYDASRPAGPRQRRSNSKTSRAQKRA